MMFSNGTARKLVREYKNSWEVIDDNSEVEGYADWEPDLGV